MTIEKSGNWSGDSYGTLKLKGRYPFLSTAGVEREPGEGGQPHPRRDRDGDQQHAGDSKPGVGSDTVAPAVQGRTSIHHLEIKIKMKTYKIELEKGKEKLKDII